MLTAEDMAAHLRGITHYRNFVQEVKSQISKSESNAAKKPSEETEVGETEVRETEVCETGIITNDYINPFLILKYVSKNE